MLTVSICLQYQFVYSINLSFLDSSKGVAFLDPKMTFSKKVKTDLKGENDSIVFTVQK